MVDRERITRRLERLSQAIVDLGAIGKAGDPIPDSYAGIFAALSQTRVIDDALAERMAEPRSSATCSCIFTSTSTTASSSARSTA